MRESFVLSVRLLGQVHCSRDDSQALRGWVGRAGGPEGGQQAAVGVRGKERGR